MSQFRRYLGPIALALAVIALVASGIVGLGRPVRGLAGSNIDMAFFYAAGEAWSHGLSPYDYDSLVRFTPRQQALNDTGFAYPPQTALLSVALAALPYDGAKLAMWALNLLALAALAYFATRRFAGHPEIQLGRWVVPAIAIGNPFTSHVVWLGQSSLIVGAALTGAWTYALAARPVAAGVLLGIATIKPQFALLPIAWLLCTRRWRPLAYGALTAFVLSLPAVWVSGPVGALREWFAAVAHYQHQEVAALGFRHVFGLQNLLHTAGLAAPSLLPVALAGAAALWWRRARVAEEDVLALLLTLALLFIYCHDYDLAALAPLAAGLWLHLARPERLRACAVAWGLAVLLFVPQRLLRGFGLDLLLQYRSLVLLALGAMLLHLTWKRATSRDATEPAKAQRAA